MERPEFRELLKQSSDNPADILLSLHTLNTNIPPSWLFKLTPPDPLLTSQPPFFLRLEAFLIKAMAKVMEACSPIRRRFKCILEQPFLLPSFFIHSLFIITHIFAVLTKTELVKCDYLLNLMNASFRKKGKERKGINATMDIFVHVSRSHSLTFYLPSLHTLPHLHLPL